MECCCSEVVGSVAARLVHLGIYRWRAIGGLGFNQSDVGAFCGVRGMFLPGIAFTEPSGQDRTFLAGNHLWVRAGAVHRLGAAFRRTEGNPPLLSYICVSAIEGSPAGVLAKNYRRANL